VSVNERGKVVVEIEESVPVNVDEIGPLSALDIDRKRILLNRCAGGSIWKHGLGAVE
jgi:hypothetical protein